MPITLGSNIASLTAQRRLAEGTSQLSKTYERLSSGQRINRASDDAAGLAISDSLRAGSRIFNQGIRNLNDGISLLNIADSAIENLTSIVVRLEELAEQAANGTYGATQRKAIDAEAQALSKEFFRISKTSKFNGLDLLGGSLNNVNLQAGFGENSVLSAGVGGAIGDGTMGNRTAYSTGSTQVVGTGDFNGDGKLDIVNAGLASLQLYLGSGNGSFAISLSLQTQAGANAANIDINDFNDDGNLDIALINYATPSYLNIFLGNGNGTFANRQSYQSDDLSIGLASGDFNGDGILDLVTGRSQLKIMYGTGGGNFTQAVTASTTFTVEGVTAADFNNDGITDIAATGNNATRIFLGSQTGLITGANYSGSVAARDIENGDLNGDGKLDLIVADTFAAGTVSVLLGNGDGTFSARISYVTGSGSAVPHRLKLSDFNGDGFLDAATVNGTGNDQSILLGNGSGGFKSPTNYSVGANNGDIAVGDFNGDGVADIAASESGNNSIGVRLANTIDGVAPLLAFSLRTMADARQALPMFQSKRNQLAAQRGEIGAFQSRIQVATNVLQVTSENFKAAESRIRDADIAAESADLTRLNILQQAAASVLAQANQQPALALRLLGGAG